MRTMLKTANRLDSFWTLFLVMPALIVMINAGIAMKQGQASSADLGIAAGAVVEKAVGQYTPYVQGTSSAILSGTNKLSNVVGSCFTKTGPVYLQAGVKGGCPLKNAFPGVSTIRPHASY